MPTVLVKSDIFSHFTHTVIERPVIHFIFLEFDAKKPFITKLAPRA